MAYVRLELLDRVKWSLGQDLVGDESESPHPAHTRSLSCSGRQASSQLLNLSHLMPQMQFFRGAV